MSEPLTYEIRVREVLDEKWALYFAPFEMAAGADETVLTGPVQDQAELLGVLMKISNLGLKLISVNPLRIPEEPAA